jgi:thiol:disulfide interchange protein
MNTNRLQFRIRTILLAIFCVAILATTYVQVIQNQPPNWKPYSAAALRSALDQDRCVLITLSANWDVSCFAHERVALNSSKAYRAIRNSNLVTLRADATNFDLEVKSLMDENSLITLPAFLLYNPSSRNEPTILNDLVSEEQLLAAIRSNSMRSSERVADEEL